MNWYLQVGKENDVIINTSVSYFRNLRNFKFETENLNEIKEIEELIKSKLPSLGYNLKFLKMKDMDEISKKSLFENRLIPQSVLDNKNNKSSLLINDEENICIILNSENHIQIQVFNAGMEIQGSFNLAKEIDEKFEKNFDIAENKKYGYLTTSPIEVGTGLKVEISLHLPGLTITGNIRKILQNVSDFGMNFTSVYVKDQEPIGDMYKISNKQTLGISEENIVKNITAITKKIIDQEREARKLIGTNKIQLEDLVYRKYGLLTNAKRVSFQEALELMSDIKMGTDLGIIDEINDEKIKKVYYYIKSANLQKYLGQNLDKYEQEIKRAEIIKQILKN